MTDSHTVNCQRHFSHGADAIWQTICDFYSDWHPYIERCKQEGTQPVRRFTMPGSEQVYREQLIYYSDTQRCFRYVMLEGIAGVESYWAGVEVQEDDDGCLLSWWADIAGDDELVHKVAKGTAAVFEAGFDELENSPQIPSRLPLKRREVKDNGSTSPPIRERRLGIEDVKCDSLALTHHPSPNNSDWLCLFLHGIGGNCSNWDDQLPVIAEIMPCAALDLRGYGNSKLGDSQTTVEDYCFDIKAVAEHFGSKKLVLAGLSYGSWIATHFALHYPDELDGLVLCGGCTGMSEAPDEVRQDFLQARLEPMSTGQTPADFADNVVQIISGPKATDEQRATMHESMAAITSATYRDALHCFTHPTGKFNFGKLSCPALLMTGEHDKLAPPEEIRSVALRMTQAKRPDTAGLPNIRFEVLKDAGHMANLEQPKAYNHFAVNFLEQCAQNDSS